MNKKKLKKQPDKADKLERVEKIEQVERVEKVNGDERESQEKTPERKHQTVTSTGPDSQDGKWYLGVCKWFNGSKGWGFVNLIEPSSDKSPTTTTTTQTPTTIPTTSTTSTSTSSTTSSSSRLIPSGDVFVHQGSILMGGFRSLAVGEEVEFQAARREGKGWEAVAVRGVGGSEIRGQARPGHGTNSRTRKVRCFNCGNLARHLAADCPKPPLPKRCHHCKVREITLLTFN